MIICYPQILVSNLKKIALMSLVLLFGLALFVSPAAFAKNEDVTKEYVCHITYVDCEGGRAYGHVIYVSTNAVSAHCNHGDHFPIGVIRAATVACIGVDNFDKCVANYAIGQECSRAVGNVKAVQQLCGQQFEVLELCPVE